jgi:hypothetical protein
LSSSGRYLSINRFRWGRLIAAAAAIGVREGISVILRQADHFQFIGDQLWVFTIGVFVYGLILQSWFFGVMVLRSHLAARVVRPRLPPDRMGSCESDGG